MKIDSIFKTYNKAIEDYHIKDSIEQNHDIKVDNKDIYELCYKKCWIDTIQWHCEDEIRSKKINGERVRALKSQIDILNQKRTDMVEKIDDLIFIKLKPKKTTDNVIINTESPSWALDRLSILALKLYHMNIEANNNGLDNEKLKEVKEKYNNLLSQKDDLIYSIKSFIVNTKSGKSTYSIYRQHKMYNDEQLNPILRSRL